MKGRSGEGLPARAIQKVAPTGHFTIFGLAVVLLP